MNKAKFTGLVNSAQRVISKHSPEILTGLGLLGMFGTVVSAVKATTKASRVIDTIELREDQDEPTKGQIIKATWKYYIPTAVGFVSSAACIVCSNRVNLKRNAALAAAYQISQQALLEYKDKVVETIGEKKEKKIRDDIVKDHINNNPVSDSEVIIVSKDGVQCRDELSGRYFKIDLNKLDKAENELNRMLINNMYASLNEFYDLIDLKPTRNGETLGWNIDNGLLHIEKHYVGAEDGTPCVGISFNIDPRSKYSQLY